MDTRLGDGNSLSDLDWIKDRLEIAAIQTAYGHAVDMLSAGDLEDGRWLLKSIFAEDAVIDAYVPSKDPDVKPTFTFVGPDSFVDAALKSFSDMGYTATNGD